MKKTNGKKNNAKIDDAKTFGGIEFPANSPDEEVLDAPSAVIAKRRSILKPIQHEYLEMSMRSKTGRTMTIHKIIKSPEERRGTIQIMDGENAGDIDLCNLERDDAFALGMLMIAAYGD